MDNLSVLEESSAGVEHEGELLPRKSLSQPSLVAGALANQKPVSLIDSKAAKMRSIPIIQTWQENEELKGQMYSLRCEAQMYQHRYNAAKETMHRSVQEVLDEYVTLKLNHEDMEEKMRECHEMNQELITLREKMADSQEKLAKSDEMMKRNKLEFEQKLKEMELSLRAQTDQFRHSDVNQSITNTTLGSFRGTLDDRLKKDDPNCTVTTWEDKRICELEIEVESEKAKAFEAQRLIEQLREDLDEKSARLADSENAKAQLIAASGGGLLGADISKTFVLGNARDSVTAEQLKYIDELETNLKETTENLERTTTALGQYMNKVSKLEKELNNVRKNLTLDSSSILVEGKTAEELKMQISKVNAELNVLRTENRNLRVRCSQLTGGDGNASTSFTDSSRLPAGISPFSDISRAHATGLASISTESDEGPRNIQSRNSDISDSDSFADSSTARRVNAETEAIYAAAVEEFQNLMRNETIESSFNVTMPPPGRETTESFLKAKADRSSPMVQRESNHSFASRTSSAVTQVAAQESLKQKEREMGIDIPLMQEVQHVLDTSHALIEGSQNAVADIERMKEGMITARNAVSRLFDRLKSSAALFEEILEKMGSSSPLAEKIRMMKLAFENSMIDHADVSKIMEAAENELTNLSINFSMLEKSIVGQSFDVSRRFSIAPNAEDIKSSSLLNASYSPIFKFDTVKHDEEMEKLRKEIVELKDELERNRVVSSRRNSVSPGFNSSMLQRQLSDVQIKAAQNFEDLEVCQATMKRIEGEKMEVEHQLKELTATCNKFHSKYNETKAELTEAMKTVEEERKVRKWTEAELEKQSKDVERMSQEVFKQHGNVKTIEELHNVVEELKRELYESSSAEQHYREQVGELEKDRMSLYARAQSAEAKIDAQIEENERLIQTMQAMSKELEDLRTFERSQTNLVEKMSNARQLQDGNRRTLTDTYTRGSQTPQNVVSEQSREIEIDGEQFSEEKVRKMKLKLIESRNMEKEAFDGLEKIRRDLRKLIEKELKVKIVNGDVTSLRLACEEICKRLQQEKTGRDKQAETLRIALDNIEEQDRKMLARQNQENVAPISEKQASAGPMTAEARKSTTKYGDPTRQVLHDSTQAVDAIVQKLKKTVNMPGMGSQLKETIAHLIMDSRSLRDFLHHKLSLFKSIDLTGLKNHSCEQLLEKLEKSYQDMAIVDDQCRKLKKELRSMKQAIPTLGTDVEERIKREIGGIAKDMNAVERIRK